MSSAEFMNEPESDFVEPQQDYPVVFGVTMTPIVSAIVLGLVGLVGAVYILMNFVLPTYQNYQKLLDEKADNEAIVGQFDDGQVNTELGQLQAEIQQTRALSRQVLSLFSSEETLQTLLLDINRFIQPNQAELANFEPVDAQPKVVSDGSLGPLVNNKLKRQQVDVELLGTFQGTQSTFQDLERLQPLLLVGDLKAEVEASSPFLVSKEGKLDPFIPPILKTTFQMDVILPLSSQDKEEIQQQEATAEEEEGSNE